MPPTIFARAESRDFPAELSLADAARWMTTSYLDQDGGPESREVEGRLFKAVKNGLLKYFRSEEGQWTSPILFAGHKGAVRTVTIYYVTPEQLSVMARHEDAQGCWGECVQAWVGSVTETAKQKKIAQGSEKPVAKNKRRDALYRIIDREVEAMGGFSRVTAGMVMEKLKLLSLTEDIIDSCQGDCGPMELKLTDEKKLTLDALRKRLDRMGKAHADRAEAEVKAMRKSA